MQKFVQRHAPSRVDDKRAGERGSEGCQFFECDVDRGGWKPSSVDELERGTYGRAFGFAERCCASDSFSVDQSSCELRRVGGLFNSDALTTEPTIRVSWPDSLPKNELRSAT